jgi:hypothetical protein
MQNIYLAFNSEIFRPARPALKPSRPAGMIFNNFKQLETSRPLAFDQLLPFISQEQRSRAKVKAVQGIKQVMINASSAGLPAGLKA